MTDIISIPNGKKNGVINPVFVNGHVESGLTKAEEAQCRKEDDPFAIALDETDLESAKSSPFMNVLRFLCVIVLLYIFICSLDFMASAFRLISGKTAGAVFQNDYISNPVVGLVMGILVTVLVQSSSTSTSIVVSMVNAKILVVRDAIPMIMGANIGTSVTNTIVSITQIGDRNQFRRAFAGATVHDMFNWITVILMLTIEVPTRMLERMSESIVHSAFQYEEKQEPTKIKILKHLTEPFTKMVIQIDKKTLTGWSHNDSSFINKTLNPCYNTRLDYPDDQDKIDAKCNTLFAMMDLDDTKSGVILLIISLFLLCMALILIVKILNSMLKGTIARVIKKVINSDIPYVPWLTGYVAILIGAVMTFVVQSSSIFTSTLTPLIGLGLISVDRSYPLTLGSNIGTTTTAMLASIAGEGDGLMNSVQIAMVHLLFNIFGIMIFYPIPFMRWPIPMCKILGNITAQYRWFALMYLFIMFFLLPALVFGLSLGGPLVMKAVGVPILAFFAIVILLNVIQAKIPRILPSFLKNWNFLPLPLRSLEPYDKILTSPPFCKPCRNQQDSQDDQIVITTNAKIGGIENFAYTENQSVRF